MNEEKMITLETEDGERVDFYVLEETRINGTNYLLVTDSEEDDEEGECYILKDQSKAEDADALYEFVEDDEEMDYLYKIFAELMDDMDFHEHTTTKRRTFLHKLQTVEIIEFQLITLECIVVTTVLGYLDTYLLEQLNQVVHIQDVRHVGDAHRLVGKDCGTDNLQGLVLGALRCDSTFERMTALYDERLHKLVYYI